MVEQPAVNRRVIGSSPISGAIRMFWAYILQNPKGQFYIGYTNNLENRVYSHNRTDRISGKFTRKNGPWHLVWNEEYQTRAQAVARERQIKSMKSAKWIREYLLNGRVPTLRD